LLEEYDAHELAADQKYRGKLVEVRGTVSSTGRSGSTAYVELQPAGYLMASVRCEFTAAHEPGAARLNPKDEAIIKGVCRGKGMFGIVTL
jgi:hypothetical protein